MCWFDILPYILRRDPQGGLWSNKLLNRTLPCKLIGSFISTHIRLFGDRIESHRVVGGNVIQHTLAVLYQWECCFNSLKSFQSCLTARANVVYSSDLTV